MERGYKEKLSVLSMIVQLAKVDNSLEDSEIEFFVRVAKKLDVPEEDYMQVFKGKYEFAPPERESDRIVLFHNLLLLLYIDNNVDDQELLFCYELALKLGLNTSAVQNVLNKLKEQPQIGIDPFRIDRVFKRYYN